MAKILNLIRHTTPNVEKGILYGHTDLDVVESFKEELKEIILTNSFLPNEHIVYSSPLNRCKVLAENLFSQEILFDSRLKELNFGDWEMKPWQEIDPIHITEWKNDFVNTSPPNGESIKTLSIRVYDFLEELKPTPHRTINIVAHAGVIHLISLYCLNKPLESFEFNMKYGAVYQHELK